MDIEKKPKRYHSASSNLVRDDAAEKFWLFRCLISASIHAHFQPISHESSSYSRGCEHTSDIAGTGSTGAPSAWHFGDGSHAVAR